ncbi:MAG: uracil-DNA glycosylase [Gammaproteobacteria bacterium]|nr:uracil-DNA glycosylase [Gammaproteobacteria bacterium]
MADKRLKIDCTQCQHYYVTWDVNRPHGCRFFAFKSPYSPAMAVFESSGNSCEAFEQKQFGKNVKPAAQPKKDDHKNGWVA